MADSDTKVIISIETLLKGLNATLKGLSRVEQQLKSIANVKVGAQATATVDKTAAIAERALKRQQQAELALQRQRSAALIAEERKRIAGVEALQKQRSTNLIAQDNAVAKSIERNRQKQQRDVESLQRQRSAALVSEGKGEIAAQARLGRAAESLQRQRSAAIIAEERKRIAALEVLQKKHDAGFQALLRRNEAQQIATNRRLQSAAESLQRQRSAAIVANARVAERAAKAEGRAGLAGAPQLDRHVQDFRRASQAAADYNAKLSSLGNAARSAGQGLASFGQTLSFTLTPVITALGAVTVRSAVQMDSLKRGLTAIVGSSAEAGKQLVRLTELAKLPGIGFQEAIQGSIRLQAVGFSAKDAEKSLKEFANAVALTGGGRDELARITVQLGQLAAKGKVLSQDLRPIIEAAPAVGRALKQAFGTVNADDIAELSGSSEEFLKILVAQLEQLPRAAAGAKNAFENFSDSLFRAAATVGEVLLPALITLVDFFGPIITTVSKFFAALPGPIQALIVVVGVLLAGLGPLAFVVGQLVLSAGRLAVALAQVNGALPTTTVGLFGLATGANAATGAIVGLRTALIASGVGLVGIAVQVGLAVLALSAFSGAQEEAIEVSEDVVKARAKTINSLENEVKFLDGLQSATHNNAEETERLIKIYGDLNDISKARIKLVTDESSSIQDQNRKLAELIKVKKELLEQELFASQVTALTLVNNVTIALEKQARAQEQLNRIQSGATGTVGEFSQEMGGLATTLINTKERAAAASAALKKIGESKEDSEAAARAIEQIAKAAGISTKALLDQARAAAGDAKEIAAVEALINKLSESQEVLAAGLDKATEAFLRQQAAFAAKPGDDLIKAGDAAAKAAERRRKLIQVAGTASRELFVGLAAAMKDFNFTVSQNVELQRALQRESEITGKSIAQLSTEAVEKGLEKGREKSGTGLRNAQQQFNDALLELQQAQAEQELRLLQSKNDIALHENETAFKQQLISYRQYLQRRASLTNDSLDKEIEIQALAVEKARASQVARTAEATVKGIPAAERTRREAQAAKAQQEAVEAETKLTELTDRRVLADQVLRTELAETFREQRDDIRQLEIEYARLQGRIESAFKAETLEQFRQKLKDLADTQALLLTEGVAADKIVDPEDRANALKEIAAAKAQNQREIERILNTVKLKDAQAEVAGVEAVITNAKERQSDLEKEIARDVDFRGLHETEALRRRLAGEEELKQVLITQRNTIQDSIKKLGGLAPPPELLDRIVELNQEIERLGKLSFTEQFDIAAKEFSRIQDELADKIENVERAVRSRDIAEIQGRLIIRGLNGEYIGQLEQQLAILQKIADQSNDDALKRQAAAATQTVKDTRAAADEMKNLNKQIKSVAIDAFSDSLSQLFKDLRDNTESAAQDILNFFNNILNSVNDFIGKRLAEQIVESLFPDPTKGQAGGGVVGFFKGIFGGGQPPVGTAVGGLGAAAGVESGAAMASIQAAATALAAAGTTVATTLTTAGVTTSTALTSSGTVLAATLTTSMAAAAAGFSAAVIAAGVAFAAAVAAAAAAQATSAALGGLGGAASGFAATGDFVPAAVGGRVIRVAEGGHDEAILTTDPKHALRQSQILREYLKRTRGLYGRFRPQPEEFASGGWVSARQAEMDMLGSLNASRSLRATPRVPDDMTTGSQRPVVNLRNINQFNTREVVGGHLQSAEGAADVMNIISQHADEIGRRIGVK